MLHTLTDSETFSQNTSVLLRKLVYLT